MGTRHRQAVISKDGELKIQQYGQWDGYPSGQGVDILDYLRQADLQKYQENLGKITVITDEQVKELETKGDWKNTHPYLSRDCGANIHQMIEDGEVEFVSFIDEEEARKWCEGFYTINFKDNTFTAEYYGKSGTWYLDNLPTNEIFEYALADNDDEEE